MIPPPPLPVLTLKTHANEPLRKSTCTGFVFNEKIFIICIVGV